MRRFGALMAVAVVLMLTGCAASGIPEFDREQTEADQLELPERYADTGLDDQSMRHLAEHDGSISMLRGPGTAPA